MRELQIFEKRLSDADIGALRSAIGCRAFYMTFPYIVICDHDMHTVTSESCVFTLLNPEGDRHISFKNKWYETEAGFDYKEWMIEAKREDLKRGFDGHASVRTSGPESRLTFQFCDIIGLEIYEREHIDRGERIVYDGMIVFKTSRDEYIALEAPADMSDTLHVRYINCDERERFDKRLNREFKKKAEFTE